jgi:hypothetical protein
MFNDSFHKDAKIKQLGVEGKVANYVFISPEEEYDYCSYFIAI